jgi:hypothetical protein
MSGRKYNPVIETEGEQVRSVRLEPGNVILTMRHDTGELSGVTVERLEVTPEGSLLLWLRPVTAGEFEARAAESRHRQTGEHDHE